MKSPILYFLLLILKISLNLNLDTNYKYSRLSKTLPEKGLKFILNKKNGTIAFNLSLVLLPVKIDLISEKYGSKKKVLIAFGTSRIKIVFVLPTKVLALYI